MRGDETVFGVIDTLEALGIPYMLAGCFPSNYYGTPGSTGDADFFVQLNNQSMSVIADRLAETFRLNTQTFSEGARGTSRHVFDVVGVPFQIQVLRLSDDSHDQQRFQRRRQVPLLGREVFLPTAEDVIITKLRWALHAARTKDRDDVRDVIAVQGERIDWDYVHHWCEQHGTRSLLDQVRTSIPPL